MLLENFINVILRNLLMVDLNETINLLIDFRAGSLKAKISDLENTFQGVDVEEANRLLNNFQIDDTLLEGALTIKEVAGQINVIIHAVGILLTIPKIFKDGELIEYLSLGAGSTGKKFDLETNLRVAEFKFIKWKGGAEAIRQNRLFKDFYNLAEDTSGKEKYLYLLGLTIPLKFLRGGRALSSVLSRDMHLSNAFTEKYGERFMTVNQYFRHKENTVKIVDLNTILENTL